jgi:hypothetical protein
LNKGLRPNGKQNFDDGFYNSGEGGGEEVLALIYIVLWSGLKPSKVLTVVFIFS